MSNRTFGVRRSDFVRRLSDQIVFLPVPKPDIDRMHLMDERGTLNTRQLPTDFLPKPKQCHLDPNPNPNASRRLLRPLLQTMIYQLTMALSHMFFLRSSSVRCDRRFPLGQGIVTDRSYWSFDAIRNILRDFAFVRDRMVKTVVFFSSLDVIVVVTTAEVSFLHHVRVFILGYDFLLEYTKCPSMTTRRCLA